MDELGHRVEVVSDEQAAINDAGGTIMCRVRSGEPIQYFGDPANLSPWKRFLNWLLNQTN